jgi:hypothetical protein
MKNAIAILLLLLCIMGCNSQNQEGSITFAKGYEDNSAIPKLAIELTENGKVFIYSSIPKIDTAHYYEGKISCDSVQQIIQKFNTSFGRFSTSINPHIADDVKLEIVRKDLDKKWYLAGYSVELTAEQYNLTEKVFYLEKAKDLSPIPYHSFDTSIQYETLPLPPPLPN